jgi:hypothetical protein
MGQLALRTNDFFFALFVCSPWRRFLATHSLAARSIVLRRNEIGHSRSLHIVDDDLCSPIYECTSYISINMSSCSQCSVHTPDLAPFSIVPLAERVVCLRAKTVWQDETNSPNPASGNRAGYTCRTLGSFSGVAGRSGGGDLRDRCRWEASGSLSLGEDGLRTCSGLVPVYLRACRGKVLELRTRD